MKKKNKTFKAYEKLLREDHDWDYSFLISLEKKKLKRMYDYFSKSAISEDDPRAAKEIGLCLRLLDIIQENDPASKEFLRRTTEDLPDRFEDLWEDSGNGTKKLKSGNYPKVAMFPIYVNYRNESRFHNGRLEPIHRLIVDDIAYSGEDNRKTQVIQYQLESLRYLKALHLYNKIRAYKMLNWWN